MNQHMGTFCAHMLVMLVYGSVLILPFEIRLAENQAPILVGIRDLDGSFDVLSAISWGASIKPLLVKALET